MKYLFFIYIVILSLPLAAATNSALLRVSRFKHPLTSNIIAVQLPASTVEILQTLDKHPSLWEKHPFLSRLKDDLEGLQTASNPLQWQVQVTQLANLRQYEHDMLLEHFRNMDKEMAKEWQQPFYSFGTDKVLPPHGFIKLAEAERIAVMTEFPLDDNIIINPYNMTIDRYTADIQRKSYFYVTVSSLHQEILNAMLNNEELLAAFGNTELLQEADSDADLLLQREQQRLDATTARPSAYQRLAPPWHKAKFRKKFDFKQIKSSEADDIFFLARLVRETAVDPLAAGLTISLIRAIITQLERDIQRARTPVINNIVEFWENIYILQKKTDKSIAYFVPDAIPNK